MKAGAETAGAKAGRGRVVAMRTRCADSAQVQRNQGLEFNVRPFRFSNRVCLGCRNAASFECQRRLSAGGNH
jgi:hypothetical protein